METHVNVSVTRYKDWKDQLLPGSLSYLVTDINLYSEHLTEFYNCIIAARERYVKLTSNPMMCLRFVISG